MFSIFFVDLLAGDGDTIGSDYWALGWPCTSPLGSLSGEHRYINDTYGNWQFGGWGWFAEIARLS